MIGWVRIVIAVLGLSAMNPASARARVSIPAEIVTTRRNAIVRAVEKASGAVVSINTHR